MSFIAGFVILSGLRGAPTLQTRGLDRASHQGGIRIHGSPYAHRRHNIWKPRCSVTVASESQVAAVVPPERKAELEERFEKKFGAEELTKLLPRILELEVKLSSANHTAKERNRRIAIAISNAGKKPWNTGRKHSKETLEKIRQRTAAAMKRPSVLSKLRKQPSSSNRTVNRAYSAPKARRARSNTTRTRSVKSASRPKSTAGSEAKLREKLEAEAKRKEAFERLKIGRDRVKMRKVDLLSGLLKGQLNLKSAGRDLSANLFPGTISAQQLDDLEKLVEEVNEVHRHSSIVKGLNRELTVMLSDGTIGAGEKALIRDHISSLESKLQDLDKAVESHRSRLPSVDQLSDYVNGWIAVHESAAMEEEEEGQQMVEMKEELSLELINELSTSVEEELARILESSPIVEPSLVESSLEPTATQNERTVTFKRGTMETFKAITGRNVKLASFLPEKTMAEELAVAHRKVI